ncbi:hypothetical protein CFREI_10515 [Corynebacterium freiburgense]|nr:hypothetical protein CFREI_10515 [Corynebacterium freiburgense]
MAWFSGCVAGGLVVCLWFSCVLVVSWDLVGGWEAFLEPGWEVLGLVGLFGGLVGRWLGVLSQIPFFQAILWNLRHDR